MQTMPDSHGGRLCALVHCSKRLKKKKKKKSKKRKKKRKRRRERGELCQKLAKAHEGKRGRAGGTKQTRTQHDLGGEELLEDDEVS